MLKNYWASWYSPYEESFELNFPWWFSGYAHQGNMVCAAIKTKNKDDLKNIIQNCYDNKIIIEYRFIEKRCEDWIPFCDRFPKADWMQWFNQEQNDGEF